MIINVTRNAATRLAARKIQEHFGVEYMSDITVVRGNDLYFPQGNEKGDYYEPLFIARQYEQKAHGRTPAEAIENLMRKIDMHFASCNL